MKSSLLNRSVRIDRFCNSTVTAYDITEAISKGNIKPLLRVNSTAMTAAVSGAPIAPASTAAIPIRGHAPGAIAGNT